MQDGRLWQGRCYLVARGIVAPSVGTSGFPRANLMLVPRRAGSCGISFMEANTLKNGQDLTRSFGEPLYKGLKAR